MKVSLKVFKMNSLYSGLTLFTFFILMQLTTWLPLRFWKIWGSGNFIDSQLILHWSKCYKVQGNSIFQNYGECSGYIYGSALMQALSYLNITPSSTQLFGYTFMFLLAITMSYQTGNLEKLRTNPYVLTILISPPTLLLAERANFDILILVLVALSGLLFTKNYQSWALLPLAIATLLKFYTLPLFLLFFLLNDNNRRRLMTLIMGAVVALRVYLDLKLIQSSFPSGSGAKFGVSIWTRYIHAVTVSELGEVISNLSGVLIFIVIFALTSIVLKRMHISILSGSIGDDKKKVYFYLFFGTHLSCYFLGMNYDYRLVFFAMASTIYLYSFVSKREILHKVVLVMTILSLWLTYPSSGLEPIGDLATEIVTVILCIKLIQLLKYDFKMRSIKSSSW